MSLLPCFAPLDARAAAVPVVALTADGLGAALDRLDAAGRRWVEATGFRAEPGTLVVVPGADGAPACVLAGISDAADPMALAHVAAGVPAGDYRLGDGGEALAPARALIGWGLAGYRFERYRKDPRPLPRLVVDAADPAQDEAIALVAASWQVRDLVTTPTEHMGPAELEHAVRGLAQAHGGEVRVVTGDDLLAQNFPAIHAVGRASHRAPRLIELTWGDPAHPALAIVGKGVCFDTGGLDIKPADGMRNMKKDMGGAAHALALAGLVMARQLPVRLTLVVPAVENAVGPDAFRPGEVITTRKGLTVEIDNTDAEGRLILADALAWAAEDGPALMISMATLTGAARVALGPDLPPFFCDDDAAAEALYRAGRDHADPIWRLPFWEPYEAMIEPAIADLDNAPSGGFAGAITAALFLRRFAEGAGRYVHFDIYGWQPTAAPGRPKGGVGQGMRAILHALPELV